MKQITFCSILVLITACSSQAKEWRGITPLHSTRADVERLIGPPAMDHGDTVVYETDKERASIEYSKGPCTGSAWSVPVNTVLNIWIAPHSIYVTDLKLNLLRYVKRRDPELRHIVNYTDEQAGVRYQLDESRHQMVTLIEYFPAARDKMLKCTPSKPTKRRKSQRHLRTKQF